MPLAAIIRAIESTIFARARAFISQALPPRANKPVGPPTVTGSRVATAVTDVAGTIDPTCRFDIVTGKGLHYSARIQAGAVGSRDHAITIPFATPLSLQIISPHVVLADNTGKTISSAAAAVSVAPGVIPATIAYTITGKK